MERICPVARNTTAKPPAQWGGNGKALELFARVNEASALEPQVWWWKGMTRMIDAIPKHVKPVVHCAVTRLAAEYWRQGSLPGDITACAKLIGYDTRTLRKHWTEVVELLEQYASDMIDARRVVVAKRRQKVEAGRQGGHAEREQNVRTNGSQIAERHKQYQGFSLTRERARASNRFPREHTVGDDDDIPF